MGPHDFWTAIRTNSVVTEILERAPTLDLPEWYLTAGGLFQTVWNYRSGYDPQTGIRDYDFFYFVN